MTPHIIVEPVNKDWVFSDRLTVFATSSRVLLAVLQSCFHTLWAWRYGTTNLSLLSYSPSSCFLTLPLPSSPPTDTRIRIEDLISELIECRRSIALAESIGLTDVYNRLNDQKCTTPGIERLRDLQRAVDNAVAVAYGWVDLSLNHGFHQTNQGVRFTLPESIRQEILHRLLQRNRDLILEGTEASKEVRQKPRSRRGPKAATQQTTLF